jgi:hypothetical protein
MPIIYKITCLINNKIYIGQSKYNRNNYFGSGKYIKSALKKYGHANFIKEVLIEGEYTQEEIDNYEIEYIKKYNSNNSDIGYNIRLGGHGNFNKNRLNENDKIKISVGLKKHYENEENKLKMKNAAIKRINEGKCLEGVKIISSKENQINATKLARLKNIKPVFIKNIETGENIRMESLTDCRNYFNIKANNSLIDCIKNDKIYRKKYKLSYTENK